VSTLTCPQNHSAGIDPDEDIGPGKADQNVAALALTDSEIIAAPDRP